MIFTKYRSPTVRKTSVRSSSVVIGSKFLTKRFVVVVVGSPSSIVPGGSLGSYGDGSGFRLASNFHSYASFPTQRRNAVSHNAALTIEPERYGC